MSSFNLYIDIGDGVKQTGLRAWQLFSARGTRTGPHRHSVTRKVRSVVRSWFARASLSVRSCYALGSLEAPYGYGAVL